MIKPLADSVVIEPTPVEEKTEGGIILPETTEKERPEQGKVVAVGPGQTMADGQVKPVGVKKGDKVLFSKYGPTEIEINKKDYLIAKEEDILAIIE